MPNSTSFRRTRANSRDRDGDDAHIERLAAGGRIAFAGAGTDHADDNLDLAAAEAQALALGASDVLVVVAASGSTP
jgi:N-acetylmuramic acid 6-phosphate (MurNAc-6-P) etherase